MQHDPPSTSKDESCSSMEDKCIGITSLQLVQVQPALESFKIRDINLARVRTLKEKIKTDRKLSSILTVVVDPDADITLSTYDVNAMYNYYVIDGNHRYQAIMDLHEENTDLHQTVDCKIYVGLTVTECISLGFRKNEDSKSCLKMTDYENVTAIKKIIATHHKDYEVIYTALGIGLTIKERNSIRPHMFVAELDEQCWDLIKEALMLNVVVPSTFNCLRTIETDNIHRILQEFVQCGFNKCFLKKMTTSLKTGGNPQKVHWHCIKKAFYRATNLNFFLYILTYH